MINPNHGLRVKAEMRAVISARIQIHSPRERGVDAVGIARTREDSKVEKSHKVIQHVYV